MLQILHHFRRKLCHRTTIQRLISTSSSLSVKLYVDRENTYAHSLLTLTQPTPPSNTSTPNHNLTNNPIDLQSVLSQTFRGKTATEIVRTFQTIAPLCQQQELPLSDPMFDRLVDGLMDVAETLTDNELLTLLDILTTMPPFHNINDHNYHDIWSCLDDISCWRISKWPPSMLLTISELWYRLNLTTCGDFVFNAMEKISHNPSKRLSCAQLVHTFFLLNALRSRPVCFAFEAALEQHMHELNVDEWAVIALGYFKTKTKVRMLPILAEMLRKAKGKVGEGAIHEMTLCAIMKTVRFSSRPGISDQVDDFLTHITPYLANTSTLCILHATLLGSALQIQHSSILQLAAERIVANIDDVRAVRLKDIERLLLSLTMFDYDPQTKPCIFMSALREIGADRRNPERVKYPKCYISALGYLAYRGLYDTELLKQVLAPDFIHEAFGKAARIFPRELFILDTNIDIEVEEYSGPRLEILKRRKIGRWLTDYIPSRTSGRNLNAADRLVLDVHDVLMELVGNESKKMLLMHLLPQYSRADFVLCKNTESGEFVALQGLEEYELGDVYRPPALANHQFFALVVVGVNNTIRNTCKTVGLVGMKCRHLRKIGYRPVLIVWNEYQPLSHAAKKEYIRNKLE